MKKLSYLLLTFPLIVTYSLGFTFAVQGDNSTGECIYKESANKFTCNLSGLEIRNFKEKNGTKQLPLGDIYYNKVLIKKNAELVYDAISDVVPLSFRYDTKNQLFIFSKSSGDICGVYINDEVIGFDGTNSYSIEYIGSLNPVIRLKTPKYITTIFFSDDSKQRIKNPTTKNSYNGLYLSMQDIKTKKIITRTLYSFSPISFNDQCGSDTQIFALNPTELVNNLYTFTTNTRKISINMKNIRDIKVIRKTK